MRGNWLNELFGSEKPIIAMCHLGPLPGDPAFGESEPMEVVVDWVRRDLIALQNGGVDGVMFSNEFSLPYMTTVDAVTVAAMARVIGEVREELRVPFGVNVLWDPIATLDLAAATGAVFVREIFTGVYASDFGFWNCDCGRIVRHANAIGVGKVKRLFNIVPEGAVYLGNRSIQEIARSTEFNTKPDAFCVSGLTAGAETKTETLRAVKAAVKETPIIVNTGVTIKNVHEQLAIADAAIIGTAFKFDGRFENHVDQARVTEFMIKAKSVPLRMT
jgi:uncharacterized protein